MRSQDSYMRRQEEKCAALTSKRPLSRSLRANLGTRRPILTTENKVGTRPTPRPKDWLRECPETEDPQRLTEYRDPRCERQNGVPSDEHVDLAEWLRR